MSNGVGLRSERGPILIALMLATFLVAIDSTILATAVPTIVADLGGFDQFPWLFSIYLLAQAASVPVYGKLADTLGRKPVIVFGIVLFLVGSIVCALAWDMPSLIVFRAVQGLGAGAIIPMTQTISGDIYTIRERAKAQGYIATVWAVSSVAGPTLGGLFAQFISWEWIFWINVPLCLLTLWIMVRSYHESFAPRRERIDIAGSALITGGLVLIILGTLEGGTAWPWWSWQSLVCFGGGALLLGVLVPVERRAADPVIPPWVFTSRIVVTTALVSLIVGLVLIGLTSFVPTYLESTASASPLVAGLAVAALTLGWPVSASQSGRLYLRFGFRVTALVGSVFVVIGAGVLVLVVSLASIALTAVGCFVIGLGLGLIATPTLIAAQASVDTGRRGVVSSTSMLTRAVGSAVGVAVFGAVANALIAQQGGPSSPAAIQAGATAVFIGVGLASLVLLAVSAFIPRVRIDPEPPAAPTPL